MVSVREVDSVSDDAADFEDPGTSVQTLIVAIKQRRDPRNHEIDSVVDLLPRNKYPPAAQVFEFRRRSRSFPDWYAKSGSRIAGKIMRNREQRRDEKRRDFAEPEVGAIIAGTQKLNRRACVWVLTTTLAATRGREREMRAREKHFDDRFNFHTIW
ncbi:unnamed protein product [Microthlaspi erraticum]|uniref:Uncharacterized protein n=1 Tax=Microthlaspi erraticum TaxID=1685480 RepID=A0A6D2HS26_9BRAS|nr:unnamed protein product [Microthlaspi erraticum]